MSFRTRLTLVAAAAVALAVLLASVVVWFVVRGQLYGQVDDGLRHRAAALLTGPGGAHAELENGRVVLDIGGPPGFGADLVQAVTRDGKVIRTRDETVSIRPGASAVAAAHGRGGLSFSNAHVAGREVRVLTIPGDGLALQLARDLTDVNRTLDRVTLFLILIAAGGVALAAALGLAVSRAALAPVRRLTATTERVTETRDLSERIEAAGSDELGRLAGSFNTMLGALEESSRAQRQLVADASHELRTPLTSLRTNIEVLARERSLAPADRERLLRDVVEQLGEMTTLIGELIELARGEEHAEEPQDVRLDLVAADAIERTRRNRPGVSFEPDLHESVVRGTPDKIERAVANLLDNAAKWSPPGGAVEVAVRDGELVVRDRGPGIDDADLPHVFDRFYRASNARSMPGSGLGLAIVRQVAEAHGGDVVVEQPPDGGTRMRLRLNGTARS